MCCQVPFGRGVVCTARGRSIDDWSHVGSSDGRLVGMPRRSMYEVTHADTGEVLSRHRTRQAAIDSWRGQNGVPVKVFRLAIPNGKTLVVEGTWHESQVPGH